MSNLVTTFSTLAMLHFERKWAYLVSMRKLTNVEIAAKRRKLEELSSAQRIPLIVVVDNVRSLYNVGSIFRTSDAVQIKKLILTGFTPRPPRKEIEKTALGAVQSVPWEYVSHPLEALEQARGLGYRIICLEITDRSRPYYTVQKSEFPICLVIGNELTGVSIEVVSRCDDAIEIPMEGIKQSLNVAVAYGIAVFELNRIWRTSAT
jgi:23S rRNA (guanosine2251-2'-O)-methyltransferase